jgi:hypothetical protein
VRAHVIAYARVDLNSLLLMVGHIVEHADPPTVTICSYVSGV